MSDTHTYSSDVAFTPAVKAIQTRKGSRDAYAARRAEWRWRTEIDDRPRELPGRRPTACISRPPRADGQPYIQHRGGPKGFRQNPRQEHDGVRRLTAATGNTSPRAISRRIRRPYIFVMDYAHRRRVKIWGEARVVDDDPALIEIADAARLQGAARTGDPVQDRGVGHQLPAAHPAEIRRRRCGGGAGHARCAHRGTGSGTGRVEGPVSIGELRRPVERLPGEFRIILRHHPVDIGGEVVELLGTPPQR